MRIRSFAVALAALLSATVATAAPLPEGVVLAPTPAWVEAPPLHDLEPEEPQGGVAYLLVDDQVSVLGERPIEYRRLVYDAAGRDGLEDAGRIQIAFQPDFQTIELHALTIVRDGRAADRRAQVRAELLRLEERLGDGILDGERTLQLLIPDVRVGDRIDVAYSVVGANPVFGDGWHSAFTTGYSQAVALRRIVVQVPSGTPLAWRRAGAGPELGVQDRTRAGVRRLVFSARPLPEVVGEDGAPDWFDGYGHLDFSTARDWAGVAAWASTLFTLDAEGAAAVRALAAELALAGRSPEEALVEALAYVQREVRYVSLSLGESSYRPASPALTLERRFGDCKDKALLLAALLAEAGIEAEPVLVNTSLRQELPTHLPTPIAFDHAITRVRIDGEWRYVDPTRDTELGALADREPIRFRFGLPVAADAPGLAEIPLATPEVPSIVVEQAVRVAERDVAGKGGKAAATPQAEIEVSTRYRHGYADSSRARFRAEGAERVGRGYLDYMRSIYRDIRQLAPPAAEDEPQRNHFQVDEHYLAPFKPEEGDPSAIGNFDLRLFQIDDWVPAAREDDRRWPLELAGPESGVQEIRMTARGGWAIEDEDERVVTPWFRFDRSLRVDGDVLTVRGEWHRLADAIPAADYAEARTELHRVRDLLWYPVLIGGSGGDITLGADAVIWPVAAWLATALLVVTLWPRRGRAAVAGMLFAPGAATPRVLAAHGWFSALAIVALAALVAAALDILPALVAGEPSGWRGRLGGAALQAGLHLAYVGAVLLALRLFAVRAPYRPLLVANAWAQWPLIVGIPVALLAAGPAVGWFAGDSEFPDGSRVAALATMLTAIGLLVVAVVASLAAAVVATAAAAGIRVRVALGAHAVAAAATFLVLMFALVFAYAAGVLPDLF
jgi:hypothetical protein